MDAPMFNAQRGLSFDPAVAAQQRERRALRDAAEQKRNARAEATRSYARLLDQVEACYRERNRDRRFSS